jgi:hypothetical protein
LYAVLLAVQLLAFGEGLNATLVDSYIGLDGASSAVMVLAKSSLTVQDTRFFFNSVTRGTIYASWSSSLAVSDTLLEANDAQEGAGIYIVGSSGTVSRSKLALNVAKDGGGANYTKFSQVHVDSSLLDGNSAPIGGAIAAYNNSHVTMTNATVQDNTARILTEEAVPLSTGHDAHAGAWNGTQKLMARKAANELNHYKLGVGGALYVERSDVDISHSKVLRNRAVIDGGK